ncbi:BON domain-containing protein [Nitrogeniibacter aestuarii]|uniref:BON domain-containing protein n=1 Tax=Nitrogeniibacter aestuarii TaxID=2815343 RepID=UPI001D1179E7|nr:BON domain-containing protein [Nitrogeniibacter aestuarii]
MPSRPLSLLALFVALIVSGTTFAAGTCEVREADMSFFGDQAKTVSLGTKMRFNKVLLQEKFDVRVVGGVAILSGNVSSKLAIQTADKIARDADGIRCVQNHLKIGPPIPEPSTGPY